MKHEKKSQSQLMAQKSPEMADDLPLRSNRNEVFMARILQGGLEGRCQVKGTACTGHGVVTFKVRICIDV